MTKEEIEELKDFTIDITDIDELALGLEVCSKKSNMVIQEFANLIIELQQQNKKYKEVIDKLSKIIYEIDELRKTTGGYPSNYMDDLLDILKGADND